MAQYRGHFAPEAQAEPVETAFDADRFNSTVNQHFTYFLRRRGFSFDAM